MTTALDYKQTWNKQINKHTHDKKVSQTMSFKQSININNKHIQRKTDYLYFENPHNEAKPFLTKGSDRSSL